MNFSPFGQFGQIDQFAQFEPLPEPLPEDVEREKQYREKRVLENKK